MVVSLGQYIAIGGKFHTIYSIDYNLIAGIYAREDFYAATI